MNVFKQITAYRNMLSAVVAAFALFLIPSLIAWAYSFNTYATDCPAVTVAEAGNAPTNGTGGWGCWNQNVTVTSGEVVFEIFYHNTATTTASPVYVYLDNPSTSDTGSVTLSGGIRVGNQVVDSGSATVHFGGNDAYLVPVSASRFINPQDNNGNPNVSTIPYSQVLSNSGYQVGTVSGKTQGGVTVRFRIENGNSGDTHPQVEITDENHDQDSVDLDGRYWMNDFDNGDVFFVMDESQSAVNNVDNEDNLNDVSDSVDYYALVDNDADGDNVAVDTRFTGLDEDTDYYYTLCVLYDDGDNVIICDSVQSFTTDDNGGTTPEVEVDDESHDRDSVNLDGHVDMNDFDNGDVFFVMDESQSNVDDVENQDSLSEARDQVDYYRLVEDDADGNDGRIDVGATFTGLREDQRYYYTLCVLYDDNGDDEIVCDNVESFRTDTGGGSNNLPTVQTLPIIDRGGTFAVMDGYYSANGCSVATWFEYGTGSSLGSQSARIDRGTTSGSMAQLVSNLQTGTTYTYRAVAQNCEGVAYGTPLTFTTGTDYVPTPITPTGDGNKFVRLWITNHETVVHRGDTLDYDISWKNVSSRTLEDLVLEVTIPQGLRITDIEGGSINKKSHSLILEIDKLRPGEVGETTIETVVRRAKFREGDPVVARAIMVFENPVNGTDLEAIAYDSDTFEEGGSFNRGFLPGSFLGWLLIILVIVIILWAVRSIIKRNSNKSDTPTTPSNGEYVPYRPSPKP